MPQSQRPIILSLTTMHESGMSLLREASELRIASGTDPATLRREVVDADAVIIRTGGVVDAALMDRGTRLKVVGRHGVGVDQIDVEAATERGIQVLYTPGANTQSVCEHVFAMMIGLSKHFPQMMAALAAGNYFARTSMTGRDLFGRTLGIIGFGRIGRRVGETAKAAFNMRVLYNDLVPAPPEFEAKAGARRVRFEEVLEASEYLTLHVPLDASTRGLIGRAALARIRPDAILINASRGPVVVESAVAQALDAKRIWGYGADVFEEEPPPKDHPLIGRPDVMLTPHSAAQTEEGLRNMATWIAQDVLGVLRGEAPRNPVNDPARVDANRRRLGLAPLGL
ncbi:MAG TPA: hydroxyacid dehydrogenase [Isosphaeraceae bacterium]|nr:hydroxyacid dehydrogenase [Isosphaeraceae bacterium]